MAKTVINAEVRVSGPKGLAGVARQIQRGLTGISANVGVNINQAAAKNVAALDSNLKILNSTLKATSVLGASAAVGINQVGAAARKSATAIGAVGKAATTASAGVGKAAKNTEKLSNEMAEFGRVSGLAIRRFAGFSIATGVIFGLIRAVSNATKEAITFEREMIRVAQVTGGTISSLRGLQKEVTSLATGLGVSSTDLLKVSRILAQTGLTAKETAQALEALAKSELAPTFTNIEQTAEGAIAVMRQFGIEAKDLEKALGSVNAVAGKFAVESDDIIQAVRRAGGVFAAASHGVSEGTDALNEFIAVFTSVRATTRESAESIATGLRTVFTRLQRNTTIESLESLGISLRDLDGKFVGPFKAINNIAIALEKIDPRDRRFAAIAEELGGFRQVSKVIPLVAQLETRLDALGVAQAGQTSLSADAMKAQQSLAVQFQKTRENFSALIREVTASDTFKAFAKTALALADGFIALARTVKPLIPILTAFAAIKLGSSVAQFLGGFGTGARGGGAGGFGVGAANLLSGARFNDGGLVPGRGPNRDTVPASLTKGEFVIQRPAVDNLGVPFLERLNRNKGGSVPGLNDGSEEKFLFDSKGKTSIPNSAFKSGDRFGAINVQNKAYTQQPGGAKPIDIGGLFLKPYGVDKVISGSLPIGAFGNTPLSKFRPGQKGKDISEQAAIKKGFGAKSVLPFNIHIGSLPKKASDMFEGELKDFSSKFIERQAVSVFGGVGIPSSSEIGGELNKFNFPQISGNLFEAMIASSGAPFEKSKSNANLDFKSIPGRVATAFDSPGLAGMPGDAKRTLNQDAVASLIKKTANYASSKVNTKPPKKAKGRNQGGPGEVNAMLTKGEFVLQKKAVDRIGVANARKLNDSTDTPKFHTGGLVGLNKGGSLPGFNHGGSHEFQAPDGGTVDLANYEEAEKKVGIFGKALGLLTGVVTKVKDDFSNLSARDAKDSASRADEALGHKNAKLNPVKSGKLGVEKAATRKPTEFERIVSRAESASGYRATKPELLKAGSSGDVFGDGFGYTPPTPQVYGPNPRPPSSPPVYGPDPRPKHSDELVKIANDIAGGATHVAEELENSGDSIGEAGKKATKSASGLKGPRARGGFGETRVGRFFGGGLRNAANREILKRGDAGGKLSGSKRAKYEGLAQRRGQRRLGVGIAASAGLAIVGSQAQKAQESAIKSGNARGAGVAGAVSGGLTGAATGFALAGPLGAVVGGVAGAATSFISAQQEAAEAIAQNKVSVALEGLTKEIDEFVKSGDLKGLNDALARTAAAAAEVGKARSGKADFGGSLGSSIASLSGVGNAIGSFLGSKGQSFGSGVSLQERKSASQGYGSHVFNQLFNRGGVEAAANKFDQERAEETFASAKEGAAASKTLISAQIEKGVSASDILKNNPAILQNLALGTSVEKTKAVQTRIDREIKDENTRRAKPEGGGPGQGPLDEAGEAAIRLKVMNEIATKTFNDLHDQQKKEKDTRDKIAKAARVANEEVSLMADRMKNLSAELSAFNTVADADFAAAKQTVANAGIGDNQRDFAATRVNVFKNIQGFDRTRVQQETEKVASRLDAGGRTKEAKDIRTTVSSFTAVQDALPGILKDAQENLNKLGPKADALTFGKSVAEQLKAKVEGEGGEVNEAVLKKISSTIATKLGSPEGRQDSGGTFKGLIESGGLVKTALDTYTSLISAGGAAFDDYTKQVTRLNQATSLLVQAKEKEKQSLDAAFSTRQSIDAALDGILGKKGGGGTRERFEGRITRLTTRAGIGATTDPQTIANELQNKLAQQQALEQKRVAAVAKAEDGDAVAAKEANNLGIKIGELGSDTKDLQGALKESATSTDRLSSIQQDLAELERKKNLGAQTFETLAGGSPLERLEAQKRLRAGANLLAGGRVTKEGIAGAKDIAELLKGSNQERQGEAVDDRLQERIIESLRRNGSFLGSDLIDAREGVVSGKSRDELREKAKAAAEKQKEAADLYQQSTSTFAESIKAFKGIMDKFGSLAPLKAQGGAIVPGARLGSGGGIGDRVPAMLEPGELVVPNKSAGATVAAMQAAGIPVPGFRSGGIVRSRGLIKKEEDEKNRKLQERAKQLLDAKKGDREAALKARQARKRHAEERYIESRVKKIRTDTGRKFPGGKIPPYLEPGIKKRQSMLRQSLKDKQRRGSLYVRFPAAGGGGGNFTQSFRSTGDAGHRRNAEPAANSRKRAANRSLNAPRKYRLSRVRQRAMEITARTGERNRLENGPLGPSGLSTRKRVGPYQQARNEIRAEVAAEKARKRQEYLNRRGMQSGGRAPGGTPVSRGGGAGNFAQVADAMKGAAESLNKLVSGLGEINIPERIEMSATIEHNVNINGAEVLSQMKEGLAAVARDVVITELSKHMDLTTGETNESSGSGSTGGQTPIAGKAV